MRDAPTDIKLKRAERLLEMSWYDETPRRYDVKQLRCARACAGCVDGADKFDLKSWLGIDRRDGSYLKFRSWFRWIRPRYRR